MGRWPIVCLTQVCQGPPRSTLVTKFHPGPPLSTQVYPISTRSSKVYPGLLRSSKDYMVRPRRRSAICLGQGWRVFVVLQFCKRNDCDQRLDFARLQTNDHTLQRRARSPQQLWAGKRGSNLDDVVAFCPTQLKPPAHPALQLMRRRCLALLLDGCCCYQKGKVVFVVKRIRECTVPLCPQRGPGLFCYRANTAQKGPCALLKAVRRSTSSISNQRSCPITPSSRGDRRPSNNPEQFDLDDELRVIIDPEYKTPSLLPTWTHAELVVATGSLFQSCIDLL